MSPELSSLGAIILAGIGVGLVLFLFVALPLILAYWFWNGRRIKKKADQYYEKEKRNTRESDGGTKRSNGKGSGRSKVDFGRSGTRFNISLPASRGDEKPESKPRKGKKGIELHKPNDL